MNLFTNTVADLALAANLTAHVAAVGYLDGAHVHLCKTNFPYDRDTSLTDLNTGEADYDGYADEAVTWDTPSVADDGTIEILGTVPIFADTGSTTPNQIYGLYVTNTAGSALIACGGFDNAPLPMINASGRILVTLRWRPVHNVLVIVIS